MPLLLLFTGKTTQPYLDTGIALYLDRLKHYTSVEVRVIPELKNAKNLSVEQQKDKEGEMILATIEGGDIWLLDERGREFTSEGFAAFLDKQMQVSPKQLNLVIGGPYGFSEAVYQRAKGRVSLSQMTFSHQMVRLFLVEQVYRAFTILRGEPYHHK